MYKLMIIAIVSLIITTAISKVENLLKHLGDIKIKDVRGKSGDVSYEITK